MSVNVITAESLLWTRTAGQLISTWKQAAVTMTFLQPGEMHQVIASETGFACAEQTHLNRLTPGLIPVEYFLFKPLLFYGL